MIEKTNRRKYIMKIKVFLLLICFCLLPFFSLPAWAEEKQTEEDFTFYDLGEIVVSGEKPAAVTEMAVTNEITAEQIKATNSKNVAEAMAYVPGVRVSTGRKNQPSIQIHGFNQDRILVLIDGVPYYEQNYHTLDLTSIPTDNIAKIVVTKGAASVLYGAGAMAGVVNIITKKATTKPSVSATFEMGENNTNRESFSAGWKKGILSGWLNYVHEETAGWRLSDDYKPVLGSIKKNGYHVMENGGFRNNSDSQKDAISAKVGLEFNQDSEYYANFYYIDREKGVPPSTREINSYFTDPPAFTQFNRWNNYNDYSIDLSGRQKICDQLTLKGKLFYHHHQDDYDSYDWYDFDERLARSRYQDSSRGLMLFADYQPVSWDILRFSYHLTKDIHEERDDEYLPFAKSYSYTGSLGMENEFTRIKNLALVAGVSYDWFDIKGSNYTDTDDDGNFDGQYDNPAAPITHSWNPMGGLTYQIDQNTKVFTSVAKKTRFPTLQELYSSKGGNIDLKTEQSVNTTLGINRALGNLGWVEVAYFYHRVSDWIDKEGPERDDQYVNIGRINMWGIEFNSEFYLPIKDLVLNFDYMYNHARNPNHPWVEYDGGMYHISDKVPNVPEHKFDVGLRYIVPRIGTKLNFNAIYVAKTYDQVPTIASPDDELRLTDSQMTFDFRITQPFMQHYEAYMAMQNMFDRDYEPEYGFPAMGRSVWFGLTAKY
jgi:outer membrane receptor protein involved in Fe transport